VAGTGMCECYDINMPEESCDARCQKTRVQTSITSDGMLVVSNNKATKKVDPST